MTELNLPHKEPIKFAKYIVSKTNDSAIVKIQFNVIPTLAMIVEAAAQSAAALGDKNSQIGFLVSLKNIKLLKKLEHLEYDVKVTSEHQLGTLSYFKFEVFKDCGSVSYGTFIISVQ